MVSEQRTVVVTMVANLKLEVNNTEDLANAMGVLKIEVPSEMSDLVEKVANDTEKFVGVKGSIGEMDIKFEIY